MRNLHQMPLNASVARGERLAVEAESIDPRPDLARDHEPWRLLLDMAYITHGSSDPESLFWVLHGLRCCGAELAWERGRWHLLAGQDAEYAFHRERYLLPRARELTALLQRMGADDL